MTVRKEPPDELYVYWCRSCGKPALADTSKYVLTTCPFCKVGEGDVVVDLYVHEFRICEIKKEKKT